MSKHVHGGAILGQPEAELHFIVCTARSQSARDLIIRPWT